MASAWQRLPIRIQDFVIANQVLEHFQNPLLALQNMLRVLKPGGVLYLSLPDKRFSFDVDRPVTTVEHVLRDYRRGTRSGPDASTSRNGPVTRRSCRERPCTPESTS